MDEVDDTQNLIAARILLKTGLETSRALASALEITSKRLEGTNRRLLSLEAALKPIPRQICTFVAIKDNIVRAVSPASAVLKVYDATRELENSLMSHPCSDFCAYLSLVKQLEEALKFLADNCGLAVQWLEGILQFLEDNAVANDLYIFNVKRSLRILQELQKTAARAALPGGVLSAALDKVENQFKRLLAENCFPFALGSFSCSTGEYPCIAPSPLPVVVIQRLQAITKRLTSNNRLEKCLLTYAEVRSVHIAKSLHTLDLDYLEQSITVSDDVQDLEDCIDQWCNHLELAVKHLFEAEYKLCGDIFKNIRADVWMGCFSKIALQSGFLSFLHFGKRVSECKKDPMKLLKLLDIFACLDNLRLDFNRLFGGEGCAEIQTLTRDLIKSVVNGACEIFWELPRQVELRRRTSPPSDGSVPRLVIFVTDYCNLLLNDVYRPLMSQVLVIHQSWKHDKCEEGLVTKQIYCILKEIGLNLDSWSKTHKDIALSYLFMINNHCHFANLRGTKVGDLMGDSWVRAHEQYKDYYIALYLRESWGKIAALLSRESRILSSPARADLVKKRLKAFNEAFDDMYGKQSTWVVPNESLRLYICKVALQAFLPLYRSYLQNNGILSEHNSSPSRYLKYTEQDMESLLSSLFQPNKRKFRSTKHSYLIGKIKNIVTDQFRFTLLAV